MSSSLEVRQRHLKKIVCVWNKHDRMHALVLPVFGSDHRVRGMIALSADEPPLWYPGIPISARNGRLTFKTGLEEEPAQLMDISREAWEGTYCMDDGRWLERFIPSFGMPAGYPGPINMAGGRIRGSRVTDVIFEAGMHRVRWIEVRAGWFRSRKVSVLDIPPLDESLEPAPAMRIIQPDFGYDSSLHDPDGMSGDERMPENPDVPGWGPIRRRGLGDKLLRAMVSAMRERSSKP